MRRRSAAIVAAVAVLAGLVSGCGGGSPLSVGTLSGGMSSSGGVSSEPAPSADGDKSAGEKTAAYPSSSTVHAPAEPTSIFSAPSGAPAGGRVVIQNPSAAEVMQTGTLPDMAWGRPDAPVTLIKYASLTCPYCRRFHAEVFPELKRTYIDTGKVRFVIREFPIGRTSGNATIALRCAPAEKYLDLYGKFLAQQAAWVSQDVRLDAIHAVAKQVGMPRERFDACLKDTALIDGLKWVKDRGRTLGIIGTPNFFLQARLVKKVLTWPELRDMIEAELKAPTAAAAGAGKG